MRSCGRTFRFESKIKSPAVLKRIVAKLKMQGKRIVFTNGCFDIIHYGHVKYLQDARSKGDALIVALNSDSSVRQLKGPSRPIVCEKFRASVIAALESVDYVVLFSQNSPYELIKAVKPSVLVKGGDWKPKDIVGSDIVRSYGGRVLSIKFVNGFSTTNIIEKITRSNR